MTLVAQTLEPHPGAGQGTGHGGHEGCGGHEGFGGRGRTWSGASGKKVHERSALRTSRRAGPVTEGSLGRDNFSACEKRFIIDGGSRKS